MEQLIRLLKGDINSVKLEDGKILTLMTSRDTEDDSIVGFYLDTPLENGNYNKTKISNTLGYSLMSSL